MRREDVLLEPKLIVPDMIVVPLTVNGRHMVSEALLLMVREPHTNVLALLVTGEPAAIITASAEVGVPFGLHVVVVDQSPPAPVLV
jgi:CBS domain-containing protein